MAWSDDFERSDRPLIGDNGWVAGYAGRPLYIESGAVAAGANAVGEAFNPGGALSDGVFRVDFTSPALADNTQQINLLFWQRVTNAPETGVYVQLAGGNTGMSIWSYAQRDGGAEFVNAVSVSGLSVSAGSHTIVHTLDGSACSLTLDGTDMVNHPDNTGAGNFNAVADWSLYGTSVGINTSRVEVAANLKYQKVLFDYVSADPLATGGWSVGSIRFA